MAIDPDVQVLLDTVNARLDAVESAPTTGGGGPGPYVSVAEFGVTGDGSDEHAVIQAALDDVNPGGGTPRAGLWFPKLKPNGELAVYRVSEPLRVLTEQKLMGPAMLQPTDDFDWVNHPTAGTPGNIALIELWNHQNGRNAFSRIYIDDLYIDCRGQAGSTGLLTKLQQPAYTDKLRIDGADVGWRLEGQDGRHNGFMSFNCGIGLLMEGENTMFMGFDNFNVELFTIAAVRQANTGGMPGPNWFRNVHLEANSEDFGDAIGFDIQAGGISIENGWATMGKDNQIIFRFGEDNTYYHISQFRLANVNDNQVFVEDKFRGYTRMVGQQRHLDELRGLFQNDSAIDIDDAVTWLGWRGGKVSIGGVGDFTPAAPQLTIQAEPNQSAPLVRYVDNDGTVMSVVDETGQFGPP